MHGSSLYVYASVYRCICMDQVVIYVSMHGSSYVYASVYMCICMDRVMYMRVFICVYAWIELCICECLYVYMHG